MSRIPFLAICCITLFVVIAEKLCGTDTYFLAAVGVIFVVIGVTYNLLGGLRTISGILFAGFALRTIVASQFLKVFFREPADLNLEAAHLTITVYLIFYCSLAFSSALFGRLKLPLPQPIEAHTQSQARIIYVVSLVAGTLGTFFFLAAGFVPQGEVAVPTMAHSIGLVLSNLLYVALVLAIDQRIRQSGGAHSAGWAVLFPAAVICAACLLSTQRGLVLGVVVLYALVCYFRGYRFRKRHLLSGIAFALFFLFVYSPFELYSRSLVGNMYFADRVTKTVQIMEQHPNLTSITSTVENEGGWGGGRTGYLSGTKSNALQRPTLIWEDSTLISACASGFRYGWTSIRMDILYNVPRIINPNKPEDDASPYVGRVAGLNPDEIPDSKIAFGTISDAFAGFGIPGVVVLGFLVFPAFFAVYRSVFDLKTVWGTVALAIALPAFGELRTGQILIMAVFQPIYLIGLSWMLNAVAQIFPTRGEAALPPLPATAHTTSLP